MIHLNDDRPIFLQIAEGIKESIITGTFAEETQIPSITEFSVTYKINPATALKGINLLVDEGIVYKKRGLGMFVSEGAATKLLGERKEQFFDRYIKEMLEEAKRLNLTQEDLVNLIERGLGE